MGTPSHVPLQRRAIFIFLSSAVQCLSGFPVLCNFLDLLRFRKFVDLVACCEILDFLHFENFSFWLFFVLYCLQVRQTTMYTPGPSDQRPLPPSTPQHSTPPTQSHPTASQPHPTTFYSRPLTRPHTLTTYHNTLETRMHRPSKTTLSQRVSPSTAGEIEDAVQARTSNTWNTASTRSGDTGEKGQTTLVRVNEGGRRNR